MPDTAPKITVGNVYTLCGTTRVDATECQGMRRTFAVPLVPYPLTAAWTKVAVLRRLSRHPFHGGASRGRWIAGVPRDPEDTALPIRQAAKPLGRSRP